MIFEAITASITSLSIISVNSESDDTMTFKLDRFLLDVNHEASSPAALRDKVMQI